MEIITVRKDWYSIYLKRQFDLLSLASGNPVYEVETQSILLKWHFKLMHFNVFISLISISYFAFFVPQDLIGFISTGNYNFRKLLGYFEYFHNHFC